MSCRACGIERILALESAHARADSPGAPVAGHGEAYLLGLAEGCVIGPESIAEDAVRYCIRHRLFWEATGMVVERAIASAAAEAVAGGAKPS